MNARSINYLWITDEIDVSPQTIKNIFNKSSLPKEDTFKDMLFSQGINPKDVMKIDYDKDAIKNREKEISFHKNKIELFDPMIRTIQKTYLSKIFKIADIDFNRQHHYNIDLNFNDYSNKIISEVEQFGNLITELQNLQKEMFKTDNSFNSFHNQINSAKLNQSLYEKFEQFNNDSSDVYCYQCKWTSWEQIKVEDYNNPLNETLVWGYNSKKHQGIYITDVAVKTPIFTNILHITFPPTFRENSLPKYIDEIGIPPKPDGFDQWKDY